MKNVKVLSFMAVSKGRAATEEVVAKRLQGVAAGTIEAVNPDLKTIKELFPHSQAQEEPKYVGTTTVKNSKDMDVEVPQIRIALIFKTDPAISTNNGIEATLNIPIFLAKGYSYSHKNGITKVKVIDKYGRTGWATQEEVKTHAIPQYANGPANIDKEYHPCLIGEDELVSLIIAYLGLPRPDVWNDDAKKFEMKTKPEELAESVCLLDHMDDYFKGDISEIREILAYQPDNRVKVILGIRTNNNGNQYQAAYTKQWLKLGTSNYKNVTKEIEEAEQNARDNGREPSTQFVVGPLEEVTLSATNYQAQAQQSSDDDDNPFPAAAENANGDADPFAQNSGDDMPFENEE